jgi:PTS system nitrogen regulatory IIA component
MQLSVADAARLLKTTEKQIYAWVDDGGIPFFRVNEQLRFNRAEVLEWATERRLPIAMEVFHEEQDGPVADLAAALETGGVHVGVPGKDKAAVLRAVVERLPLPPHLDRELLLEVMLAREAMGSTAFGNGIAVPHVRYPVAVSGGPAALALCYLETPVEFAAVDGRPVHTVFGLVSPTIRTHLTLLAKLASALHDDGFKTAVLRKAPLPEVLAEARRIEAAFPRAKKAR